MERRNLALLCAGVLCFWLFALAFGTAEGRGVAVQAELPTAAPAAVEEVPVVDAAAQPQLSLNCRAAILVDQDTGTVLYENNADEQVPIASITKVMTLLLTFEAIHNGQLTLETTVPVSEHAYHMGGSQIWLEPGEQFTLDEMIKAICVSSANDAAVAVAELVGGSEPAFVERMNARAAELGMEHTTFHNACGLDTEGHLSTARDVAVMSCQILNTCPEVLHYTGIWHGANWNFICWGLYYFVLLAIEKLFLLPHLKKGNVWPHIYTLFLVVVGWAMFVGNDTGVSFGLLFHKLFVPSGGVSPLYFLRNYGVLLVVSILCCTPFIEKIWNLLKKNAVTRCAAILALLVVSTAYVVGSTNSPFLYFNF